MRTKAVVVILALIIGSAVGWFAWSQPSEAKDAKGCEGLADYRAAMFKAWRGRSVFVIAGNEGTPTGTYRDLFLLSPDGWSTQITRSIFSAS